MTGILTTWFFFSGSKWVYRIRMGGFRPNILLQMGVAGHGCYLLKVFDDSATTELLEPRQE